MFAYRYVEENGSAAILVAKRSAGVTPKVNLREYVTRTPRPSMNKAVHSGFKTQRRRHRESNTGVSADPQKRCPKISFKKKRKTIYCNQNLDFIST